MIEKPKRKMSAKSLANLIPPVKKGEVRNPHGSNVPTEVRKLRALGYVEVAEIGALVLDKNLIELKAIIEDAQTNPKSDHSALKVWMATVAAKGIAKGDPYIMDALMNRIVGKVTQKLEVTKTDDDSPKQIQQAPSSGLTPEDRRARILQLEKLLSETAPQAPPVEEVSAPGEALTPEVLPPE